MADDIETRVRREFNAAFYRAALGVLIGLAIAALLFAIMQ